MDAMQPTYVNPLVLPDYPNLPVKHPDPAATPGAGWGHEQKKLLHEQDLLARILGPDNPHNRGPWGGEMARPSFSEPAANDVRATADPSVLYHEGKWYLYCTSGMVYHSEDFVHWIPHPDTSWMPISAPMAPTVACFRGRFYASANSVPLHVSDSPVGPWKLVGDWTLPSGEEMLCGDVMLFADDDDRLYLYWGLGSAIFGSELDPERPNHLLTEPKILIDFNSRNAWERGGEHNENWRDGCLEGSWMYKRNGVYYLTYSAAGTSFSTYSMGAYIGTSPLGEFHLQRRNPISVSTSGLVRGGGHGSIVDGPNGTIWCFYTIPVGIDHIYERRIGMDPCGIDENGELYALTGSETPQFAPGVLAHPELGNSAGLDVCNYFLPHGASSHQYGRDSLYAIDGVLHTWWEPLPEDQKPVLETSTMSYTYVSGVRIIWKDVGLDFQAGILPGPYRYRVEAQPPESGEWTVLVDASDNTVDLTVDYRTFPPFLASKIRLVILGAPTGLIPGVIDFSVFGESAAKRDFEESCSKELEASV